MRTFFQMTVMIFVDGYYDVFYTFRKGNQRSFGRRLKLSSRMCIENIQKRGKKRYIAG